MPRVVKFFQENHAHEREESVRFFEAGVKEGLFRKDVDFNVVMDIGHVMMEEIMHHQLYRVHSMQEIYDNYILCLIRGFCTFLKRKRGFGDALYWLTEPLFLIFV